MRFSPRRTLGRVPFKVTPLGIGDVADRSIPRDTLVALVRRALDAGLNLVDTAPGYEAGYSEEIVGEALRGRDRNSVFLVDKIDHLDRPVRPQVEESLERLQQTQTDLFVFHSVSTVEAWQSLVKRGAFDELNACRAEGLTHAIGISSHHPDVLRAALDARVCDVVMFPVGPFVDAAYVDEILPRCKAEGVGTICFKTFGAGKLLGDTEGYNQPLTQRPRGKVSSGAGQAQPVLPRLSVEECLHYTLTIDPDVTLLGMSFPNEQDAAFHAFGTFKPLSPSRIADIRERARTAIEGKGRAWWNPH